MRSYAPTTTGKLILGLFQTLVDATSGRRGHYQHFYSNKWRVVIEKRCSVFLQTLLFLSGIWPEQISKSCFFVSYCQILPSSTVLLHHCSVSCFFFHILGQVLFFIKIILLIKWHDHTSCMQVLHKPPFLNVHCTLKNGLNVSISWNKKPHLRTIYNQPWTIPDHRGTFGTSESPHMHQENIGSETEFG